MKNNEETNEKIAKHISHITRSDEDRKGETREAQVSQMNKNSLQ